VSTTTTPTTEPLDIPGVTRRHRFSDLYHERTNYQFVAHSRRWFVLSLVFMIVSVGALVVRGLNLGIEFEGGTSWQVPVTGSDISVGDVRDLVTRQGIDDPKVSTLTGQGERSVRVQAEVLNDPVQDFADALANYAGVGTADVVLEREASGRGVYSVVAERDPSEEAVADLARELGMEDARVRVDERRIRVVVPDLPASPVDRVTTALAEYADRERGDVSVSTVGPTWGGDVSRNALKALLIFFVLLAVYLAVRFEWKMSAAAIACVVHDIVFTVGVYALFQFEVTPATVTSFLTILGFSLYDTVVVFDKIKENEGRLHSVGRSTYGDMVNRSLNQVLMRSLSTGFVAVLPIISLLVIGSLMMGATALQDFALALLIGLVIGAYSSLFLGAPLLAWWKEREPQYRAMRERHRRAAGPVLASAAEEVGVPVGAGARTRAGTAGERPVRASTPTSNPRPVTPRPRQQRRRKRR
jgi:preprotein translocase subunit SecF